MRLNMKKLVSAYDVLIWGKDRKKTEEKLIHLNLIIKEYGLWTMRISSNLDTHISTRVNDTLVNETDKFIYFQTESRRDKQKSIKGF
jgi:hypothetical protein